MTYFKEASCRRSPLFLFASSLFFLPLSLQGAEASQESQCSPLITQLSRDLVIRGDSIVVLGQCFQRDNALTRVRLDGRDATSFEVVSATEIKLTINDDEPSPDSPGAAGGFLRDLVVVVGNDCSESVQIEQLTWAVWKTPRVLTAWVVFLLALGSLCRWQSGGIFKSATGELSLSKVQMALWTVVFGFSYMTLAVARRELFEVADGVFWLMGVSAATGVGAKVIAVKNAPPQGKPSKLLSEYNHRTKKHEPSLHRCQMALWTVIVVTLFLVKFYEELAFPEIPESLWLLMGVSGTAYLGFNYPKALGPAAVAPGGSVVSETADVDRGREP